MQVAALGSQVLQLREEMRAELSATRAEARAGDEETRRALREGIRAGDEETRRQMRILHEDLMTRIARIGRG